MVSAIIDPVCNGGSAPSPQPDEADVPSIVLLATDAPTPDPTTLSAQAIALTAIVAEVAKPRAPAEVLAITTDEIASLVLGAAEIEARLDIVEPPNEQADQFDKRFRLLRSASPDVMASALAHGVVLAAHLFANPDANPADTEAIADALAQCAGNYMPVARRVAPAIDGTEFVTPAVLSPRRQWDSGHQLFSIFGAETTLALRRLSDALDGKHWTATNTGYDEVSTLLRAIGATMRLAGQMMPSDYDVVRRSMEPPYVPAGFSGLFDGTHTTILRLTRAIARKQSDPSVAEMEARFIRALNTLYHAHACVCAHVAGEQASLAARNAGASLPGHLILRQFAKRALNGAGFNKGAGQ